jgi:hypothetical protein
MIAPFTLSPTTQSDIDAMTVVPLGHRIRAETARVGDEIVGVAGFSHLPDGSLCAFAFLTDAARKRKIQLHKQALRGISDARARGAKRIIALASPDIPGAAKWLDRLGFSPVLAGDQTIYVWSE